MGFEKLEGHPLSYKLSIEDFWKTGKFIKIKTAETEKQQREINLYFEMKDTKGNQVLKTLHFREDSVTPCILYPEILRCDVLETKTEKYGYAAFKNKIAWNLHFKGDEIREIPDLRALMHGRKWIWDKLFNDTRI